MLKYTLPPMRPEVVVCPNSECGANGRIGVHSHKERRYICHACKRTFADTSGTLLYRLKQPIELVLLVVTLLAYGCPIPADDLHIVQVVKQHAGKRLVRITRRLAHGSLVRAEAIMQ